MDNQILNDDQNLTNQLPDDPNDSGVVLSSEKGIYIEASKPVETKNEVQEQKETLTSLRPFGQSNPEDEKKIQDILAIPVESKPIEVNTVDQTDTITSLHHIQKTSDTLTQKADEEEEEFITKVEAAHGHK